MKKAAPTASPWKAVRSFNGWRVTRTWSTGFYQVMRGAYFKTQAEAEEAARKGNEVQR